MIAALRFDASGSPRFEPATNVRLTTVCAVANAVSEHVTRLLDCPVTLDLFEPVTVPFGAQPALFADARVSLAHGRRGDLLVIVRERDARRLLECAFRVDAGTIGAREFSPVEEQVLDRIAAEIARLCTPLCGEISSVARAHGAVDGYACTTYFEFRFAPPIGIVVGIGLSRDPAPASERRIEAAALGGVALTLTARLGATRIAAREIGGFAVGTVVPFATRLDEPATLLAGGVPVGRGECGVHNGAYALRLTSELKGTAP